MLYMHKNPRISYELRSVVQAHHIHVCLVYPINVNGHLVSLCARGESAVVRLLSFQRIKLSSLTHRTYVVVAGIRNTFMSKRQVGSIIRHEILAAASMHVLDKLGATKDYDIVIILLCAYRPPHAQTRASGKTLIATTLAHTLMYTTSTRARID